MCIITDSTSSFHPLPSHRILYVGYDHTLLKALEDAMKDCQIVRCPGGSTEHALIKSSIDYSLFVFDEELPSISGPELAALTRTLAHRAN
ncbi:MAG: hypothetical protein ICV68_13470, partial [Pyrinomonadaceae bacterium]|nr:hypothetical protein [Pyrinomonadaceae bacterium]